MWEGEEFERQRLEDLSAEELESISSRQQQYLRMQRNHISKEERLKGLIAQYHRHEQKLDNLRHIRTSLQTQENRLHELKQVKGAFDRQNNSKNQLGEELEKTKAVFAGREKELAEAVAKVDILTAQLDRTRAHNMFYNHPASKNSAAPPEIPATQPAPNASLAQEIERLKHDQRFRTHLIQQQKRKIDEKDTSLLHKTLERNQLDQKINDIAERLQKRRLQGTPVAPGGTATQGKPAGRLAPLAQSAGSVNQAANGPPVATVEPYSQRLDYHFRGYRDGAESTKAIYSQPQNSRHEPETVSKLRTLQLIDDDNQDVYGTVRRRDASDGNTNPKPTKSTSSTDPKFNGSKNKSDSANSADAQNSISDDSALSSQDENKLPLSSSTTTPSTRIELILRETSNLPNLVTDTLQQRDRSREEGGTQQEYVRSTETPDTSSSASETAFNEVVPISDPTPPKAIHHRHHGHKVSETPQQPPVQQKHQRRVKFDPQALLLDASLEGELELVIKTCQQVMDPSASNDEGITALHNAICAGHFPIVKFLVEYGCNVNAQDSDGWSPLHCAASCNNLAMCKFLIEHGACIFATTHSDHESAAQKCEEDEADYDSCFEYLMESLKSLGHINDGIVYSVYDYEAQNQDELSFKCGDKMKVLSTTDDQETEWYWAEKVGNAMDGGKKTSNATEKPGYIPRNLLALHPRVERTQRSK